MPNILGRVDGRAFSRLIFGHYGIELSEKEKSWFAFDGKELKGSILPNDKRGEAVVLIVRHEDKKVYGMDFFNGSKDSEVTTARNMLEGGILRQKLSMDPLHFKPDTLIPIHGAGGFFLAGLKGNQKELLAEMEFCSRQLPCCYQYAPKPEKGHGRIEQRTYSCFDVEGAYFDKRWDKAGFKTLVRAERQRFVCNRQTNSVQVSYYLSNMDVQNEQGAMELFQAVRQHWQVESANYDRDCILKEDKLRCIDQKANQTMALCRTLVIKLLNKSEIKNRCELMDSFADDFKACLAFLRSINFL